MSPHGIAGAPDQNSPTWGISVEWPDPYRCQILSRSVKRRARKPQPADSWFSDAISLWRMIITTPLVLFDWQVVYLEHFTISVPVTMNHSDKYPGQRSLHSKVVVWTHTHTHTTDQIAPPGPQRRIAENQT